MVRWHPSRVVCAEVVGWSRMEMVSRRVVVVVWEVVWSDLDGVLGWVLCMRGRGVGGGCGVGGGGSVVKSAGRGGRYRVWAWGQGKGMVRVVVWKEGGILLGGLGGWSSMWPWLIGEGWRWCCDWVDVVKGSKWYVSGCGSG